jgi:hypothetical protein
MNTYIQSGLWRARNSRPVVGELNLTKFVKDNSTGGIPEAPLDNISYARKNAEWVELPPSTLQDLNSVLGAGSTALGKYMILQGYGGSHTFLDSGSVILGYGSNTGRTNISASDIVWDNFSTGRQIKVAFSRVTNGNVIFTFPEVVGGSYVFATVYAQTTAINTAFSDFVKHNATTVALTSDALTSLYGYPKIGTRIQCPSIAGGPIIYEWTSTGWVSTNVTKVL